MANGGLSDIDEIEKIARGLRDNTLVEREDADEDEIDYNEYEEEEEKPKGSIDELHYNFGDKLFGAIIGMVVALMIGLSIVLAVATYFTNFAGIKHKLGF